MGAGDRASQPGSRKPETLYELERASAGEHRIIPLAHLRETYGIAPRVHFQPSAPIRSRCIWKTPWITAVSFRTKVFLSITGTVVLAVWVVAAVVSTLVSAIVRAQRRPAHRGVS